jgi:hypothetical protein
MREPKKPKGTKPGSRKGQRTQRLSDAIKQAKTEGQVWVTHPAPPGYPDEMWRLKIEPTIPWSGVWPLDKQEPRTNIPQYCEDPVWALLRCKAGIGLFEIHDYKGERLVACTHGGNYRTITEDDVLAVVSEKHKRDG